MEKILINFQPKVSIVIPVYNGENYLLKAIDSAVNQSYENIEVIVVNDGSNDNGATRDIALSFGNKIKYYEKENGGVSTALNFGIEKMTGEYFSWLSHDDEYYLNKIQKQVDFLSKQKQKDIILFSNYVRIDANDRILSKSILPYINNLTGIKAVFYAYISGCTLLIPKICFDEVGIFDEKLPVTQDYDLWFKFAFKYQFEHMSDFLVKSRLHVEQTTHTYSNNIIECNNLYINFLNKMKEMDIEALEKYKIIFYIKLLIKMEQKKYSNVVTFIFERKLQNYPKPLVSLLHFYYSQMYTSWYTKISLFTIFSNPIWSSKKILNFFKFKVIKYG